jgi:hypothetical protein
VVVDDTFSTERRVDIRSCDPCSMMCWEDDPVSNSTSIILENGMMCIEYLPLEGCSLLKTISQCVVSMYSTSIS